MGQTFKTNIIHVLPKHLHTDKTNPSVLVDFLFTDPLNSYGHKEMGPGLEVRSDLGLIILCTSHL